MKSILPLLTALLLVAGLVGSVIAQTPKTKKSRTRVRVVRQLADGFVENRMNGSFIQR